VRWLDRIGGGMAFEVTDEAVELLRKSLELGGVDPSSGGVRLRAARGLGGGVDVQVELAEGPLEEETVVETRGLRLFVDPEVARAIPQAIVAVEPQHDFVVVRPAPPEEAG
jgi:Fe-S cluster assembly iron-binding protein IscA